MAGMIGADIAQMRALEAQLNNEARAIREIAGRITGKVNGTTWKGTDSDKFRNEWDSSHKKNLEATAVALEAVAVVVKKNAEAQEATSAA
jgi:uncharacterized protein YukE